MARVLHVLSQRPGHTGSGTMLEALVRRAADAGWTQAAVVGVPAGSEDTAGLERQGVSVFPVMFDARQPDGDAPELGFDVPGMSDVMPYPSSRFSSLDPGQLDAYRAVWTRHLAAVAREFSPDIIHSNHVWLVSSFIKDAVPGVPVVTQCHATGLRQMELCPHLRDGVIRGVRRNERFVALHEAHAAELARILDVAPARIRVVGAGYREDLFHAAGRQPHEGPPRILYAGKYSSAKGVPQLLDAFERLASGRPGLSLHIAGSGAGDDADALRRRMERMAPGVVVHGEITQAELASLMRTADVFVLPSLYEGIPLVLIEALACGCRLVATALPGVMSEIEPRVGDALVTIPMPALNGIDRLAPAAGAGFTDDITRALDSALDLGAVRDAAPGSNLPESVLQALKPYAWTSLFGRIAGVWAEVMGDA